MLVASEGLVAVLLRKVGETWELEETAELVPEVTVNEVCEEAALDRSRQLGEDFLVFLGLIDGDLSVMFPFVREKILKIFSQGLIKYLVTIIMFK